MENLPTWLTNAVAAAGMTVACIEELDGKAEVKAKAKARASAAEIPPVDFIPPALH